VRILLSEPKTARLICRGCRAVVELPVGRLDGLGHDFACPVCRHCFPCLRGRLALDAEGDGPPALDLEPDALPAPRRGKGKGA
jgi:hypothetical protein